MPPPDYFMANPAKPMVWEGQELTVGMHLIMAVTLLAKQRGTPVMAINDCLAVVHAAEMLIGEMLDAVSEWEEADGDCPAS